MCKEGFFSMAKTERRPQVLLLGNGLNQAYGASSWDQLMKTLSIRTDLPDKLSIPRPLQAVLVTNDTVDTTMKRHANALYGGADNPEMADILRRLLSIGFDHILTTNYSYELEDAALPGVAKSEYKLKKLMRHTSEVSRANSKYLLHTYNEVEYNGKTNNIWHIHGEARKPDSMIIGHYYYANLLYRYRSLLNKHSASHFKQSGKITSWLDAFVAGDIYILGFGFDVSEMDLWWLLNRKKCSGAGDVYFFEPESCIFDEKAELLKLFNVRLCSFGFRKKDVNYIDFYKTAITKLEDMMFTE